MWMRAALVAAALAPGGGDLARADDDLDALVVSGGVNLGLGLHGDQVSSGPLVGVEGSLVLVHFDREADEHRYAGYGVATWLGLYGDLVRDLGSDTTRLTVGPEVGHELAGVDGGMLLQLGDQSRWGVTARLVGTIGVLAIYARWGHFLSDGDLPDQDFVELGILVKFPYPIYKKTW
jgi:hypothetical protein